MPFDSALNVLTLSVSPDTPLYPIETETELRQFRERFAKIRDRFDWGGARYLRGQLPEAPYGLVDWLLWRARPSPNHTQFCPLTAVLYAEQACTLDVAHWRAAAKLLNISEDAAAIIIAWADSPRARAFFA